MSDKDFISIYLYTEVFFEVLVFNDVYLEFSYSSYCIELDILEIFLRNDCIYTEIYI